jgi:hypothetical protein
MSDVGVLNGPGIFDTINVTDATPIEIKVGATRSDGRRVISVQPLDGKVHLGYDNTVTSTKTFLTVTKNRFFQLEASDLLAIWMVADSGTVAVNISEVG